MNWKEHTSNDILDIRDGTHDSPNYVEKGLPLITSKNLIDGELSFDDVNYISEEDYIQINKRSKVDKGDVLYSMIGSIGNYAMVKEEPRFAIKNVALFKFNNDCLDRIFFLHLINSPIITRQIEEQQRGGTQKFVSLKILRNLRIPLPPLPVQQKIASILDTADGLKQKNKALIAKYDELCQSLFLDMFGDPVINPKGWNYSNFGDCVLDIVGGKSVGGEERPILKGEMAVLKISAVTSGHFKAAEYKVVENDKMPPVCIKPQKNDLLFSRANTREMVGAICIVNTNYDNLFLPDKLWKIVLDKSQLSNWYIKFLLSHDGFRENLRKVATGTSGSMLNISKAKLKKINIPVPAIDLQNQFAKRIQAIEQQKQQAQASLQKSEELFNCLLQKAFKGELV